MPLRAYADRAARVAVIAVIAAAGLLALASPTAAAPTGVTAPFDCKEAPAPSPPTNGLFRMVGVTVEDGRAYPTGDAFGPDATTTVYEKYGFGSGMPMSTYDLGCDPTDLDATVHAGNFLATLLLLSATWSMALMSVVIGWAYNPSYLGVFNDLARDVSEALRDSIFTPFAPLVLIVAGGLLLWQSRKGNLAGATKAVAWALAVMVAAILVADYPVQAASVADRTVVAAQAGILSTVSGNPSNQAGTRPEEVAIGSVHQQLIVRQWLSGELGDPDSAVAQKYGPDLFDASFYSNAEWQQITYRGGDYQKELRKAKAEKWEAAAAGVKDTDPDAYEYLVGRHPVDRVGAGIIAGLGVAAIFPFLFLACVLIIASFVLLRLLVMFFPALATIGILENFSGAVTRAFSAFAAAVINPIVFGAAVAVDLLAITTLTSNARVPLVLGVLLLAVFDFVLLLFLRPFWKLTSLAGLAKASPPGLKDGRRGFKTGKKAGTALWKRLAASAAVGATGGAVAGVAAARVMNQNLIIINGANVRAAEPPPLRVPAQDTRVYARPHGGPDAPGGPLPAGAPTPGPARPHPGPGAPGGPLPGPERARPAAPPPGEEVRTPEDAWDRPGVAASAPIRVADTSVAANGQEVYTIWTADGMETYTPGDPAGRS